MHEIEKDYKTIGALCGQHKIVISSLVFLNINVHCEVKLRNFLAHLAAKRLGIFSEVRQYFKPEQLLSLLRNVPPLYQRLPCSGKTPKCRSSTQNCQSIGFYRINYGESASDPRDLILSGPFYYQITRGTKCDTFSWLIYKKSARNALFLLLQCEMPDTTHIKIIISLLHTGTVLSTNDLT